MKEGQPNVNHFGWMISAQLPAYGNTYGILMQHLFLPN